MSVDSIRCQVLRLDAQIKVLRLACLQEDLDAHADVLKGMEETNWKVHDFLDEVEKVFSEPNDVVD